MDMILTEENFEIHQEEDCSEKQKQIKRERETKFKMPWRLLVKVMALKET